MKARVRLAIPSDADAVAKMFFALWPDGSIDEHRAEAVPILAGTPQQDLPLVIFVAEVAGDRVGVIEVGLRSHADGCDPSHPVGFIEGWYVEPHHRRQGIGNALMKAAEDWARALGCREMGSDTWIDNVPSQDAHLALGFEIVDRCVNFRKSLG